MENWKEIDGFPKLFISSEGRVKSYYHNPNGKIRKTSFSHNGYARVTLSKHGVNYGFQVHRLVAEAFIPNYDHWGDKRYVTHLNGIHDDNRVENLKWVTHQELVSQGISMGVYNIKVAQKSREIPIEIILNQTKYTFESLQKAADYLEIDVANLSRWLNHRNKPLIDIKIKRISKEK